MIRTDPSVRVRFAPSPTGLLHIGGMRSALFNWLWARHTGGVFVLRLEDTDRNRMVEGTDEQIYESHEALGIVPDEGPRWGGEHGPYVQSERLDIYREHTAKLVKAGALYRCWCSPERLAGLREEAQKSGQAFKYDRHCLVAENQKSVSEPHVLRFRIPDEPALVGWDDAVRGHLEFKTTDLDDFVALKADGFPTYQFANVVDDHLMAISHVLRADEWIPSTPKHLLLYAAFGWEPPVFGHLPAVQGPTGGKKLSKRDGAKSIQEFLDDGYLPEALRSFLATLGWNDGTTQEVYATEELIERFTLDRIQKSPARFDIERLTWVNGALIRALPLPDLLERCRPFWPESAADYNNAYRREVLRLVQERLKFLAELPELTEFFFAEPTPSPELLTKTLDAPTALNALNHAHRLLEAIPAPGWSETALEDAIRPLTGQLGLKTGQFFGLLRVALTGRTAAPGLFETIAVLGREATLGRLATAAGLIANR
jgi:glutamyl-tRNA synthetase